MRTAMEALTRAASHDYSEDDGRRSQVTFFVDATEEETLEWLAKEYSFSKSAMIRYAIVLAAERAGYFKGKQNPSPTDSP